MVGGSDLPPCGEDLSLTLVKRYPALWGQAVNHPGGWIPRWVLGAHGEVVPGMARWEHVSIAMIHAIACA